MDVAAIAICTVICGADDFIAFASFGRKKNVWLNKFSSFSNGIPLHNRFNVIFAAIKPTELEKCLLSWIADLHEIIQGQIVAFDRKILRRSFDKACGKSPIHMTIVWDAANGVSLGRVVVDAEGNEISAIPSSLQLPEIRGGLVILDALGQPENAPQFIDKEADCCLAVRKNQPKLQYRLAEFFAQQLEEYFEHVKTRCFGTNDESDGRKAHGCYISCLVRDDLPDRACWPNFRAIVVSVQNCFRDGKECDEARSFILSKYVSGKKFGSAVRQSCAIEKNRHW